MTTEPQTTNPSELIASAITLTNDLRIPAMVELLRTIKPLDFLAICKNNLFKNIKNTVPPEEVTALLKNFPSDSSLFGGAAGLLGTRVLNEKEAVDIYQKNKNEIDEKTIFQSEACGKAFITAISTDSLIPSDTCKLVQHNTCLATYAYQQLFAQLKNTCWVSAYNNRIKEKEEVEAKLNSLKADKNELDNAIQKATVNLSTSHEKMTKAQTEAEAYNHITILQKLYDDAIIAEAEAIKVKNSADAAVEKQKAISANLDEDAKAALSATLAKKIEFATEKANALNAATEAKNAAKLALEAIPDEEIAKQQAAQSHLSTAENTLTSMQVNLDKLNKMLISNQSDIDTYNKNLALYAKSIEDARKEIEASREEYFRAEFKVEIESANSNYAYNTAKKDDITEEIIANPIAEEQAAAPVVEDTTEQAVVAEEQAAAPVVEDTTEQAVVAEEQAAAPVVEDATEQAVVAEEQAAAPVVEDATEQAKNDSGTSNDATAIEALLECTSSDSCPTITNDADIFVEQPKENDLLGNVTMEEVA